MIRISSRSQMEAPNCKYGGSRKILMVYCDEKSIQNWLRNSTDTASLVFLVPKCLEEELALKNKGSTAES